MLSKSMSIGFVSFWLLCTTLTAQTLINSFPILKAPFQGGYHFPYQDENGSAHMLLYQIRYDLRVLYLDQDLNLVKDARVEQEAEFKRFFEIVGFIDQAQSLIIIAQFEREKHYAALIYDKQEHTLKRTGLEIPLRNSSLRSPGLYVDDAFASVQIHRKSSELVVYRTRDGYELESDTFLIAVDNLYGKMEVPETKNLFVITSESGNSLFSNIPENKMYLYGEKVHLTLEDIDEGFVTHFSIDLNTREQRITNYQLPRYTKGEAIIKTNCLIYEDLILLAAYQKEGLKLEIHEFGEAGLTQAYEFPTDAEMDDYFLMANAERKNGVKMEDKELLHSYLSKSLLISVEPTAEGDLWLVVGSIPQMSQAAQTALFLSVTVAAAFLGSAIDPNVGNWISFDPVGAIESGGYMLINMADRYGKFVYRVGAINAGDLSLKYKADLGVDESEASANESELPLTAYDKMLVFLDENKEYRKNAASQIIFPYRDGIVKGFTTPTKEFKLYYFE